MINASRRHMSLWALTVLIAIVATSARSAPVPGAIPNQLIVGSSGHLEYSVPIPVLPGTGGMEPKLALVYSSQGPTGSLGAGWSLSGYSRVSRGQRNRVTDGFAGALRLDAMDAFYLDGARLIPTGEVTEKGVRTRLFRKEIDDQSLISSTLDASGNPTSFQSRTKAGLTLFFGGSANGNVTVGGQTLVWLCTKILDTTGNYMTFEYLNSAGDYELQTVRYSGHDGDPVVAPYAEVKFEYETNKPSLSSYVYGENIRKTHRLRTIRSRLTSRPFEAYTLGLEYTDTTTASRFQLAAIRFSGSDGTSFEPLKFSYSESVNTPWARTAAYDLPIELSSKLPSGGFRFLRTAVADGRGPSLVFSAIIEGALQSAVYQNTAAGWLKLEGKSLPAGFLATDGLSNGTVVMDINGDGLDDLITSRSDKGHLSSHAYLQQVDGWKEEPEFAPPFAFSVSGKESARMVTLDADGDARVDLIGFRPDGEHVTLLNRPNGWVSSTQRWGGDVAGGPFVLDSNCDGRLEPVALVTRGARLMISALEYSGGSWQIRSAPEWEVDVGPSSNDTRVVASMQSSCAALFLGIRNAARGALSTRVFLGTGMGWQERADLAPPTSVFWDSAGNNLQPRLFDVTGDGLLDLINREERSDGTRADAAFVQLASADPGSGTLWRSSAAAGQLLLPVSLAIDGQERTGVVFLDLDNDQRLDLIDLDQRGPGTIGAYLGTGSTWAPAGAYTAPVEFARLPQHDVGVRFVDLNNDGLVDILYNRSKSPVPSMKCADGKDERGAFINRGDGWDCVDGYIPPIPFPTQASAEPGLALLDVNSDGFVDLVYSVKLLDGTVYHETRLNAFPQGHEAWGAPADAWKTPVIVADESKTADEAFRFVDVNGDGRVDLIRAFESIRAQHVDVKVTTEYFENTGVNFVSKPLTLPGGMVRYTALADGALRRDIAPFNLGSQLIDVDGDHVPDFVAHYRDPNSGRELSEVHIRTASGYEKSDMTFPLMMSGGEGYFLDINSDGLPDYYQSGKSPNFLIGNGRGWAESAEWKIPAAALSDTYEDAATRFVDLNGDGLLDLIYHFSKGSGAFSKGAFLNNGDGWTAAPDTLAPATPLLSEDGGDTGVRLIDVDGNGLPDVLRSLKTKDTTERETWLNMGRRSNLMEEATDSRGIRTRVQFQSLGEYRAVVPGDAANRVYAHGKAGGYPSISLAPAMYVVARLTTDEGAARERSTAFRYGDLRLDVESGTPLGFAWKETIDEATGSTTRSEFSQERWLSGRLVLERTLMRLNGKTQVLNELASSWSAVSVEAATRPDNARYSFVQMRLDQKISRSWDLDGASFGEETTVFSNFDDFGNVRTTLTTSADGTSLRTESRYDADTEKARLVRLIEATVTKMAADYVAGGPCVAPACEIRRASFTYDPSTLLLVTETANEQSARYALVTTYERDKFGNIARKTVSARIGGVPDRVESYSFKDDLGRLLVLASDAGGSVRSQYAADLNVALGLPSSLTNANNLVTRREYDVFGRLVGETNPVGVTTTTRHVHVSQLDAQYLARLDHSNSKRPSTCLPSALPPWKIPDVSYAVIQQQSTADSAGAPAQLAPRVTLHDRAGRMLREITSHFDGTGVRLVFEDVEYDDLGQVIAQSSPYFSNEPSRWALLQQDPLGRNVATTSLDGACVKTAYSGLKIVKTTWSTRNKAPRLHTVTLNQQGQPEVIEDAKNGKVRFTYDAGGRVTQIEGATGAKTTYVYDDGGNRLSTIDPDSGKWSYEHDPFGQLIVQKDPLHQGNPTRIDYDGRGRLKSVRTADHVTTWTYPAAGDRCFLSAVHSVEKKSINAGIGPSYTETYAYDSHCRPESVTVSIGNGQGAPPIWQLPSNPFVSRQEYDHFGRPVIARYPQSFGTAQFSIQTTYAPETGEPIAIDELLPSQELGRRFWTLGSMDASGRLISETLGTDIKLTRTLDPLSSRTKKLRAQNGAGTIFDAGYDYDLAGNVLSRADAIIGTNERFEYDALDRLTTVRNAGVLQNSVRYDASGRILYKQDVGHYRYGVQCGGLQRNETHRPSHAPCGISVDGGPSIDERYRYDANGNLARSPVANFYFSADNRLTRIFQRKTEPGAGEDEETAFSVRFAYGPSGEVFMEYNDAIQTPAGLTSIATYKLGLFENEIRMTGASKVTVDRFYIRTPSGASAFVESTDYSAAMAGELPAQLAGRAVDQRVTLGELFFIVRDALGSVSVITDAKGKPLRRFAFDPWGRSALANSLPIDAAGDELSARFSLGFTGHDHLLIGSLVRSLVHMGGRVYDSRLALFLSPDPLLTDAGSSQDLNPYMYVVGNPLKLVDPSGYGWLSDFVRDPVGSTTKLVRNTFREARRAVKNAGEWIGDNWRTVAAVAVAIVVTVYCPPCMANPVIGGMVFGATQGAAGAALYGGNIGDVLEAGARGGAIGAVGGAASYAAGSYIQTSQVGAGSWQAAAAHGVAGGVTSVASGEKFESGFVSGLLTQSITHNTNFDQLEGGARIAANAALGGVNAEIGGGKFANGAMYGSFQVMFNDWMHDVRDSTVKWIADTPDIPSDFSNAVQGYGSSLSFGLTDYANEALGAGSFVDKSSFAYRAGEVAGMAHLAALNTYGAATGAEIRIGRNLRIAPWGNRGPGRNQLPHYHRRGPVDPAAGTTKPGQGIGRHRPWDTRSTDKSFRDRF